MKGAENMINYEKIANLNKMKTGDHIVLIYKRKELKI
jgi:hypothetical protein